LAHTAPSCEPNNGGQPYQHTLASGGFSRKLRGGFQQSTPRQALTTRPTVSEGSKSLLVLIIAVCMFDYTYFSLTERNMSIRAL